MAPPAKLRMIRGVPWQDNWIALVVGDHIPGKPIPEEKIPLQPSSFPDAKPGDLLLEGEILPMRGFEFAGRAVAYVEHNGEAYFHPNLVQGIGRRVRVTYVDASQFKIEEVVPEAG